MFLPSLGHVLHLHRGCHILFWAFSHQFVCAHPADALEIPHFSRVSIRTPGWVCLDFPHIARTCTTFLHVPSILYFGCLATKSPFFWVFCQYFTIPHIIDMDSTGFHWTSLYIETSLHTGTNLDSTGLYWTASYY